MHPHGQVAAPGVAPIDPPAPPSLVSVVIPCYKQAHLLPEAIASVQAQTYPHYEIIVVDDGSPDNTAEVATSYAGVCCIRQENRGLAEARNTGLAASRGEFIVCLDADDRLLPAALATGVQGFATHPAAQMVFGRYHTMNAEGIPSPTPSRLYEGDDYYRDLLAVNYIGTVAAVMYRRAVFNEVGGFRQRVAPAADYDIYLRIARRFPLHHYNAATAEYRIYEGSMSHDFAILLESTILALRFQRPHLSDKKEYLTYYRKGLDFWRGYYGELLYLDVMTRRALQAMAAHVARSELSAFLLPTSNHRARPESLAQVGRPAGTGGQSAGRAKQQVTTDRRENAGRVYWLRDHGRADGAQSFAGGLSRHRRHAHAGQSRPVRR